MTQQQPIVFCQGGGCTAKLGPAVLSQVLEKLPKPTDPNLLVGFSSSDDAAVYQVNDELALVTTLDFFPPMLDEPYTFGQIAAANALSDIYAMGGTVLTALNIVCFPQDWDLNVLGEVLRGGSDKVIEAGGSLVGGHSINDTDIKYGLSVTGSVHPNRIWHNDGCEAGDVLILTKPLGVGIVSAAHRVGQASEQAMQAAIQSMSQLNKYAAEVLKNHPVHACTDVTGFGLIGHLLEMLGDRFSATLDTLSIPFIREAAAYADQFLLTAAAQRNRKFAGDRVMLNQVPFSMQEILFDAQTSGGLLVSLPKEAALSVCREMKARGLTCSQIGQITARQKVAIQVI